MTHFIKLSFVLISIVAFISCSSEKPASQQEEVVENITIKGTVRAIENGKDGFVASVLTEKDTYKALVSIVNLGGPEHFKTFKIGDQVALAGVPSIIGDENHLMVKEILGHEPARTELLISETSFRGIITGDAIAKHGDYVQKGELKTGEGDFEVYYIKDFNNNPAGYFLPDPNDESVVGEIVVQALHASTKEGVKMGSTFAELKAAYPSMEVHGSEIEGRTYARVGQLAFRLDIPMFTYDVDVAKIPEETKVMEIMIMRK